MYEKLFKMCSCRHRYILLYLGQFKTHSRLKLVVTLNWIKAKMDARRTNKQSGYFQNKRTHTASVVLTYVV